MKNIITEELGYMKYLFGYQRGVVISEQTNETGCIDGDCENGQGTYKFSSGAEYDGLWKDDKFNGQGTYKWSDGTVYEGLWKDNQRNGQGTYTNPNGVESSGIWVDGKLDGKSLDDLDKLTQSNQTKPESTNKANWEDVVKYYEGNKDPNWEFDKKGKKEYDGVMFEFVRATSKDTNDSDSFINIWDDGEAYFWKKGKGTGRSKGTWEWDGTKPVIKFKDISKNASGYVQPTDTDWKAVTEDNKVIGLNARGPLVKQVQNVLISIGYSGNTGSPITTDVQGCLDDVEKCDGIYGKSTKEMVKEYQKDNGLAVDGVVGQQTYESLL